jgi:hypothetical protein
LPGELILSAPRKTKAIWIYTMPYFVFRINEDKKLEHLGTHDKFAAAKQQCRDERQNLQPDGPISVRMVHAKNPKQAEALLTTPRKPSTPVEEWEG